MINNNFSGWTLCAALAVFCSAKINADPIVFDFKDPKKVNNALFLLDAPLESISGTATGISGTITFDPEKPAATKGKIVLDASTLHVDNPVMKEHMLDKGWMDVANHPKIQFVAEKFTNVKVDGSKIQAKAVGKFSVKGVTKKVTVPVTLTFLKGMLVKRNRVPGDLLVLRSDFTIKRSDYEINPGNKEEKVSDEIEIKLRVAGAAPTGK
ncbi:MAG: YceI family protein [Verrucomicrobiota bacterium]|nr:YceI family protein [Verrucomicrobiota bacterium]MEE2613961.1 YceI family protein [Verrucomicrobiota bacterium]